MRRRICALGRAQVRMIAVLFLEEHELFISALEALPECFTIAEFISGYADGFRNRFIST
jgi:hypothetical protein